MSITNDNIGKRIKEIRNYKGISQESLALECGLDRTYINSLEKGKRNITIQSLEKITNALGVTLKDFFNEEIKYESNSKDRVFLISCDVDNYNRTMVKGISINDIEKYFDEKDAKEIIKYAVDGIVYIWGTSSNNTDTFNLVETGNTCIFSRNKTIISTAELLYKCNSNKFSKKFWKNKKKPDLIWPNIFIMSKPREINVPSETLMNYAGYKKTFIQGFSIPRGQHNILIKEFIDKTK